jgi:hypothetical protein
MLKVPSAITKITTMSDRGLRLQVDTQELGGEDKAELMSLHEKMGVFVFSESDIQEKDLKNLPEVKIERGEKTPSQRLRGVLYRVWEQEKTHKTFDDYYRSYMSNLIETLKEKL